MNILLGWLEYKDGALHMEIYLSEQNRLDNFGSYLLYSEN